MKRLLTILFLLISGSAFGQTLYFSGTSNNWNTSTSDWGTTSGGPYGTTWVNGYSAYFEGSGGATALVSAVTVSNIYWGANLTKSWWLTGTGGTITVAAGSVLWTNMTSQAGTISATIANSSTLTIGGAGVITLNGIISGSGALVYGGSGTLTLTGNNSYTGTTTVNQGVLNVTGSNTTSSAIIIAAGATLNATGVNKLTQGNWTIAGTLNKTDGSGQDITSSITLNNGTLSGSVDFAAWGTYNLTGNYTITANGSANTINAVRLGMNSGVRTFNTPGATDVLRISSILGASSANSGGLIKTGSGLLILSGSSIYTGGTTLTGGILNVGTTTALGAAASTITFNGGTLQAGANNLTLGNSTIVLSSGIGAVVDTQANTFTLTSVISGSGSLTKVGAGTLTLSGANTYTAGTTINGGVLVMGNSTALGSISAGGNTGSVTLNSGTATLVVSATGTIGALAGSGGTITSTGAFTLTSSGTGTQSTTFSGVMQDGSGTLSFVKIGTGTLMLNGANSYTGGTTLTGGILNVGTTSAFGTGTITFNGGTLQAGANNLTLGNSSIVLSSGIGAVVDTQANTFTLTSVISGSGSLTKVGTGTLLLNGNNTFTGGTTVNAGALGGTGALSSGLTITSSATLTPGVNGSGTFTCGSLTTASGSQFNFTFSNGTTPATFVVDKGTLTLNNTGSVNITFSSGTLTTGFYNLIQYGSLVGSGTLSLYQINGSIAPGGFSYAIAPSGGWLQLDITSLSYTWTNTTAGTSDYWTNGIQWAQSSASIWPSNNAAAYLINPITSGTYTNIFDYTPGVGTLYSLVVSNSGAGQALLLVTNATLNVSTLNLDNGGVIEITSGGVVTNRTTANWWYGNTGKLYIDSGGLFVTSVDTTIGNNISNVNAFVTTRSLSGSGTWNVYAKGLTVGSGASAGANSLTIDGNGFANGVVLTNLSVTVGAGSSGNSLILTNGGSAFTAYLSYVGYQSSVNSMKIYGGAATSTWSLYSNGSYIGYNGGTNNVLTIDGLGVAGSAIVIGIGGSYFAVGYNSSYNSIIVTNGGLLKQSGFVGYGGNYNSVQIIGGGVSGAPSVWDDNIGVLTIGDGSSNSGATGNVVIVNGNGVVGGAMITNIVKLFVGNTATVTGSSLVITNGGQVIINSSPQEISYIGYESNSNTMMVVGGGSGGASSLFNGGNTNLVIGLTGMGNVLKIDGNGVTGGAIATNINKISIGWQIGAGNSLIITNGGQVYNKTNPIILGQAGGSSNNIVSIGGGSAQSLLDCGGVGFTLGNTASAVNNQLILLPNGTFQNGSFSSTKTNQLMIAGGSMYVSSFTFSGAGSTITFNSGLLSASSTLYSNATDFVLGNGTGAATLILNPGTHTFGNNLIVSSNGLLQANGTISTTGTGSISVSSGGTMIGNGVVNMATIIQTGGTLSPGNSSPGLLTFSSGLTLASHANYTVSINSPGLSLGVDYSSTLVTGGSINISNSFLVLNLGFTPTLGQSFDILTNTTGSAILGMFLDPSTSNALSEAGTFMANGTEFQISYFGSNYYNVMQNGTPNDIVLTVVPEPEAYMLVCAGIFGLLALRRFRKK